ncbi:MAG: acetyl-CoA C-acetyltransferase [Acidimicrobiia bacterium]
MRDAVICEPVRTAIGRYGGSLKALEAHRLATQVIKGLFERTQLDPMQVDDVIFGQCYPNGEAPAIGRVALLDAGLPIEIPGMQVDRRCGSSLQAVLNAAMQIQTNVADLVLAGGAESMSQVEYYSMGLRWGVGEKLEFHDRLARGRITSGGDNYPVPGGMLETAETLAKDYGIPREEQDEWSVESHRRAVAAQDAGYFDQEIIPVTLPDGTVIERDEHPRRDTSVEKLAKLRAVRVKADPEATVTAGNSSGQNDAASVCIVTTPEKAAELGLTPLVRLVSWGVAGVQPSRMGIGPVPATAKALARAGLGLEHMDVIELNEAFAAQVLACTRAWEFKPADFERLNVNGSGISLGHPVGATGTRILATLAREMQRRDARYGLETMCIGGGQGLAAVFEKV